MNDPIKPVDLARQAVLHFLKHKQVLSCPDPLIAPLKPASACFVTLYNKGKLRGCVGTLNPQEDTLAEEIIRNARRAAFDDPRFEPVTLKEINDLTFSVDVVQPSEKVETLNQLDPARYGLIVKSGDKQGVLLPGIEGIDTVKEQLRICLKKGEIAEDDPQEWHRFEIIRHH